jgi:pilus assembly protein TadC
MPRKNIANNEKVSYYEGIFGKGEEAKMYFAFRLIPILLFSMCGAILASFAISYILKIDFLSLLGVVVPIFSAPLTFMLGYLFGDKRKEATQ